MTSPIPRSSNIAFPIIKDIINMGWINIPNQFRGSGSPGNTLEYLLNIEQNNLDSPDLFDWEIKFHGGNALLTLFHKDPQPRGIMNQMVDKFGWENDKGQISFRHTISGESERGFKVYNIENRIFIKNESDKSITPYWEHNIILGAIAAKLRRLILVQGLVNRIEKKVIYESATAYWDLNLTGICNAIQEGIIYIDFDARTTDKRGSSLRNHGTKFRIKIENIEQIYENRHIIV